MEKRTQNVNKVTVIIPTKNEAQGIAQTIQEIVRELEDPEIIVIDANSVDGTPRIAARFGAKVISQSGQGKGSAIAEALECVDGDTKWLAIIDGDYTYRAVYIPDMIKLLDKNAGVGMVTGRRVSATGKSWSVGLLFQCIKASKKRFFEYMQRYLQNRAIILSHGILNKVNMEDPLTGLRVTKYEYIKDFRPKAKGFDIEVEINCYIRRKGYRILEFPIRIRERLGMDKFRYSRHGVTIFMRMILMGAEDIVSWLKSLLSR